MRAPASVTGDVKHTFRRLVRRPGFTLLATLTLSLGVGANAAIFSVVNRLVLHPLPFAGSDRIAYPMRRHALQGFVTNPTATQISAWREHNTVFDAMEVYAGQEADLTGGAEPRVVSAVRISPTFVQALGIPLVLGRGFTPEDGRIGATPVAILDSRLWRQDFGADPEVLGRTIRLNDSTYTVVGVRPDGIDLPMSAGAAEVWMPIQGADLPAGVSAIARRRPGVSTAAAEAELRSIAVEGTGDALRDWAPALVDPERFLGRNFVARLWVLFAAVGLVLLIACANVANMLLAAGTGRRREIGVRLALGASRPRLLAHLLAESVALAGLGAAGAFAVAQLALDAIIALRPDQLGQIAYVGLDWRVGGFIAGLALFTALAFGLWPALRVSDLNAGSVLREASPSASGGRMGGRSLLAAQVAFAVVLFLGATVTARTYLSLQARDLGFETAGVGTVRLRLPESRYTSSEARSAFFDRLARALDARPEIDAVSIATGFPGRLGVRFGTPVAEGQDGPAVSDALTRTVAVDTAYFRTLGIPIVRGRGFAASDLPLGVQVGIVNQAFADRYWPDDEPVGRRFRFADDETWTTVIGVAGNVHAFALTTSAQLQVYYPTGADGPGASLAVRAASSFDAVVPLVQRAVWDIDPNLPIREASSAGAILAQSIAQERFTAALLVTLAAIALILATVGTYGVVALLVFQRQREIAVRSALGATEARIVRVVLWGAFLPVAVGCVLGGFATWGLTRVTSSLLPEIATPSAGTVALALAVFAAATAAACVVPARRATSLDPMDVLRRD